MKRWHRGALALAWKWHNGALGGIVEKPDMLNRACAVAKIAVKLSYRKHGPLAQLYKKENNMAINKCK